MKILSLMVLVLTYTGALAQSRSYAAYLRLGVVNIKNSKSVLPSVISNVSGFGNAYYGVGGEFEYKINRIVMSGDVSIMAHGPVNNERNYAEPFAGALIGKGGFVILETKNILFYPSLGAGLSGLLVNTYTKTDGSKNDLHTIHLLTPAIDLGLNGNVIIYRFRNEPSTGILPVGIRTGFRFTTQSDNWKRLSGTSMKSQLFTNSGWYLSIALGIGYYSSRKKNN